MGWYGCFRTSPFSCHTGVSACRCPNHRTDSTRATPSTRSAVSNIGVRRTASSTGIAAAQRITNPPRETDVLHGTTRSFTHASRPATIIKRGRLSFTPLGTRVPVTIESRSSCPCAADQLTRISTTSPSDRCSASTSSGSSLATEAVCGHHAPSISAPNSLARVRRTGLASRRAPLRPFTTTAHLHEPVAWADPRKPDPTAKHASSRPQAQVLAARDVKTVRTIPSECP